MTADKTTPDDLIRGHDSHVDPLKEQFFKMGLNQDDNIEPSEAVEQAKEDGMRTHTQHTHTHTHTHTHKVLMHTHADMYTGTHIQTRLPTLVILSTGIFETIASTGSGISLWSMLDHKCYLLIVKTIQDVNNLICKTAPT